ncbi:MAG: T9SS type A sorting domain-containing protein [Flavobacterium sp.]
MIKNYDYVVACDSSGTINSQEQGETSYTATKRNWLAFLSVFMMLFSFVFVQGQSVTNYAFSTTTTGSLALDANGNTVDMSTGTTQLVASGVDDAASTVNPIGFNFIGMGVTYSNFSANSNGALALDNTAAIANSGTTNSGSATRLFIAPFGGDQATHSTGKVHYKVIGSAPNRTLVVEWLNMEMDYQSTTSNGTYQVRIYETSGVIEFVYGAMSVADTFFTGPIIGFSGGTTADKISSVTSSTNAVTTNGTAFVNNTYVVGAIANLDSTADGSRRTYVFTPSTLAVAAPTTLTFSGITSAGTTVNWVDDSITEFGFLVTRATDAAFTTNVVTTIVASTTVAATGAAYNSIQTGLTPSTLYYYKIQAVSEAVFSTEISGSQATNPPGVFVSIADGNWSDPATWDANAVPTGVDNATVAAHTVTIDVASLAINNLTVQGSLEFGAAPPNFIINGNLTLEAGSEFLVFNGTTGKAIVVSGNIVNDGNIDLSIGATIAGSLTLNGSAVQSITGSGTFANNRIRNLIFSNTSTAIPNINWGFDDVSVEYNLTISNAKINLNGNKINYGVSATSTGNTFAFTNGGFLNGTFSRWWTAGGTGYTTSGPTTIPTGAAGRYPFYSQTGEQRIFYIGRTTPTAGGKYAVTYNNATTSTTGLSITDGAATITNRWDGNFVVTLDGTSPAAASNWVTMFTPGAFFTTATGARVLGQNVALSGTHVNTSNAPYGQRSGVSTADLTSATGLYLGVNAADVPVVSIASGDWNSTSTWNGGVVPTCADVAVIANGHTVTSSTSGNFAKGVSIATGGTLVVSAGDLTVGCTLNNNTLANSGTLTVTGGLLAVNGNMIHNAASTFNQSGGEILVDGNEGGIAANSVASGVAIVQLNSQFINWTGGSLTILDPHANATGSNAIAYNNSTAHVNVPNTHTLKLGDGVSTDAGGNAAFGYRLNTWAGSNRILFGNLEVNTLGGTNRIVTTTYSLGFSGNVTIEPSSEVLFATSYVAGNIVNNGTFTSTTSLFLANYLNGAETATTNAQTIGGIGVYRNLATTPTANLTSLTVNNTNATGVTLNIPLSVSGTLTMTSGIINTTNTNLLTLGTATAGGTLAGTPSATSMVRGPFARTISNANANTNYLLFPVGKVAYAPIWAAPTTTAVTVMKAETFDTNTGTQSAAISNMATNRRWELPLVSGAISDINVRLGDAGVLATSIPVQAPSASGEYTSTFGSVATSVVGVSTQSTSPVLSASYFGFLSYADSNACIGTPTPGNTIASTPTICLGESVTLSLQNLTTGSGVTYQWQSSPDGITYNDIVGATNAIYTGTPTMVTYYQCIVTCATGPSSATSNPVQITFTNNILSTTSAARCGTGTVTLDATANVGSTINWYSSATGGTSLASGASFITPTISSTTTYYVAAETAGGNLYGGKLTPEASWTGSTFTDWGIVFTALQTTTLNSVDVYSTAAGTLNVKVTDAAGVELYATGNINVAAGGTTTPTVIPLNFNIVQGTTYKILVKASSGVSLVRGSTNLAFPYNNGAVNVTSSEWGGTTTGTYYYFYNLATIATCSSPRVSVTATVSSPPALTLSGATTTFCEGDSSSAVTLTAGGSDYNTFVWSPATGVSGDEIAGWTFNPTVTTTYTLTATQTSGALCATTASYTVNINPIPSAISFSPVSPVSACENTAVAITATGGNFNSIGFVETMNTLPANFSVVNTSGTGSATLNTTYYSEGAGSVLFNTASTSANVSYQLNSNIDLTGSASASIVFSHIAAMESPTTSYDYGIVEYSTNGGTTWNLIPIANYSGSANAAVFNANIRFSTRSYADWISTFTGSGSTPGAGPATSLWKTETINIPAAALTSNQFRIRFRYTTDSSTNYYGWLIDNVRIVKSANNVTWSPITDLYTDAAATVFYVGGTSASTVYVKSTTLGSQSYTATSTDPSTGCFNSNTVNVIVNALPEATITRVDDTLTASETGATYQWYTCTAGPVYTIIPGATSQSYTATAIGSYAVDVTLNGCTSRSTCFDVTTLGTSSFDMSALTVYPNPVLDILSIRYNEEITAINVYDLSGRLVKQVTPNQTEVEVNMSELAAAMYIVKVNSGGNQTEIKVIKK